MGIGHSTEAELISIDDKGSVIVGEKHESLKDGDRLYVVDGFKKHWCLYGGKDEEDDPVYYHLVSQRCSKYTCSEVQKDLLDLLLRGQRKVFRDNSLDKKYTPLNGTEIIKRAERVKGKTKFKFLTRNCEHFVNWCRYNKFYSVQTSSCSCCISKTDTFEKNVAAITSEIRSLGESVINSDFSEEDCSEILESLSQATDCVEKRKSKGCNASKRTSQVCEMTNIASIKSNS